MIHCEQYVIFFGIYDFVETVACQIFEFIKLKSMMTEFQIYLPISPMTTTSGDFCFQSNQQKFYLIEAVDDVDHDEPFCPAGLGYLTSHLG